MHPSIFLENLLLKVKVTSAASSANYNKMRKLILKLNKSSSRKSLFNNIIPTFAKVKGQFINDNKITTAEKEIMKNHLTKHIRDLKLQYDDTRNKIQSNTGIIFTKILIRFKFLMTERLVSFKVKNNKIFNLIKRKPVPKYPEYKVPIINLSCHELTDTEYRQLKFGLNDSFIKKDKNVKKDIATHMESLAYTTSKKVENF